MACASVLAIVLGFATQGATATDSAAVFGSPPAFYRTWWFEALLGVGALSLIALVYQWRIGQLTQRARIRANERERIARELHDTLLQSVQGMLLSVESATRSRFMSEGLRKELSHAVLLARAVVVESRDRVASLRATERSNGLSLEALREELIAYRNDLDRNFTVSVRGRVRRLRPCVEAELVAVLREAIANAAAHSSAKNIWLRLDFGWRTLSAEVGDDGCGIAPEIASVGSRDGHWGMQGMRERIREIRGTGYIDSVPGQGTMVAVRISSWRAYAIG
nr:ATP-binding protein [Dyella humicola]